MKLKKKNKIKIIAIQIFSENPTSIQIMEK